MLRRPVIAVIAAATLFMTDAAFARPCTGDGGVWDSLCKAQRKHARKKIAKEQAAEASEGQAGEINAAPAAAQPMNDAPHNGQSKPAQCVPTADKPCPQ